MDQQKNPKILQYLKYTRDSRDHRWEYYFRSHPNSVFFTISVKYIYLPILFLQMYSYNSVQNFGRDQNIITSKALLEISTTVHFQMTNRIYLKLSVFLKILLTFSLDLMGFRYLTYIRDLKVFESCKIYYNIKCC